jgi:hypothetical protein
MNGRRLLLSALLLVSLFGYCQDAVPPDHPQEQTLSQIAHEAVSDLKMHSAVLLEQLTTLQTDLTLSQEQRDLYKTMATDLRTSLTSMTQNWQGSEQKLIVSEHNFAIAKRIVIWMGAVFLIGILLRIVGAILWAKGIKLPYLLNLLM